MFQLEQNIFAWADAYSNFYCVLATLLGVIWLVTSKSRRRETVSLLVGTGQLVCSRPVLSAVVLCGLLAPVVIAVTFTNQPLNQGFLALVGVPLALWLWRGINHNLDRADGYVGAALFVTVMGLFFGAVAYLPNL